MRRDKRRESSQLRLKVFFSTVRCHKSPALNLRLLQEL
jgi:hypothetical protein